MAIMLIISLILPQLQTPPTPTSAPAAVPKILEDAFKYRTTFRTTHFEYRRESHHQSRGQISHSVENNEVRWTIDGAYFVMNGDDDGINYRLAGTMEPALGVGGACLPSQRVLDRVSRLVWMHEGSSPIFGLSRFSDWSDFIDIRTVGLSAHEFQRHDPMQMLETIQTEERFRFRVTASDSHRSTVIGTGPVDPKTGEHRECEWDIDTDKGPSVLAVRSSVVHADGRREMLAECHNELKQFDGRWWPVSTDYKTGALDVHIQFKRIEFNRPEHPWDIDPEYLGVTVGAVIQSLLPEDMKTNKPRWYVGHGKTVDADTWEGMKSRVDLVPYRAHVAKMAALGYGYTPKWWDVADGQFGLEGVAERPDEWTAYVRRWVCWHTTNGHWHVVDPLTDEQRAAAEAVLKDCKEKAAPIQRRVNAETARIDEELATLERSLTTTNPSDDMPTRSRIAALRQQKADASKPKELVDIFSQLKTRLEGLLTSRQKDPSNARLELPQQRMAKRRPTRPHAPAPTK